MQLRETRQKTDCQSYELRDGRTGRHKERKKGRERDRDWLPLSHSLTHSMQCRSLISFSLSSWGQFTAGAIPFGGSFWNKWYIQLQYLKNIYYWRSKLLTIYLCKMQSYRLMCGRYVQYTHIPYVYCISRLGLRSFSFPLCLAWEMQYDRIREPITPLSNVH